MKISYIISADFDYETYLCPDVGTSYSDLIGIDSQKLNNSDLREDCVYIVDPQMSEYEVEVLRSLLRNTDIRIVFRIIDPYWPPQDNNPLRLLAFDMASHARTSVLSAYHSSEVVDLLERVYGQNRFHVSPYPYDENKEVPFEWEKRMKKIAITGNHNPTLYPLRAFARRKRLTSSRWRHLTVDLSHPGYKISRQKQYAVGDEYIQYLSQYMMMFVCPSRASLEFLKYRECAYAGCCPIGQSPKCFPTEAAENLMIVTMAHFKEKLLKIQQKADEELFDYALRYRRALSRNRSPRLLREKLLEWLQLVYGQS